MKNEISFQQLRTPAAALVSTAIVLSLLDARDAGQHDTDTIGLMLTVIAISAALLGFLSRGSCRAQGLSGTVFAVIATAAAGLPETVEDADIHLSQAAPTLWALSGIMFGTAAATCLVQGGWYRRLIHREAPTTSLATTSVLGLLLGIAISLPLVSQPAVFTSLRAGFLLDAAVYFLCGAVITLLAAISPIVPLTCLVSVLIGFFVWDGLEGAVRYSVTVVPVPIVATAVTAHFFSIFRSAATPSSTEQ